MSQLGSEHWAKDGDAVESYLLNRLSKEDRRRFDDHLRTCPECQKIVKTERDLIRGIRSFGRQQTKSRLKERLSRGMRERSPWPRIMGMAAVLTIVVGLGVYNRWFDVSDSEKQGSPKHIDLDSNQRNKDAFGEFGGAKKELPIASRGRDDAGSGISTERAMAPKVKTDDLRKELSFHDGPDTKQLRAQTPQGVSGKAVQQAELRKSSKEATVEEQEGDQDQVWVEGIVLENAPLSGFGAIQSADNGFQKKPQDGKRSQDKSAVSQRINLSQKTSKSLPVHQQQKQKKSRNQSIPTLVTLTEGGLVFTMYLDSLVQDADLETATIEEVSSDSIVVAIPNLRVAYQIPGNLNLKASKKSLRK